MHAFLLLTKHERRSFFSLSHYRLLLRLLVFFGDQLHFRCKRLAHSLLLALCVLVLVLIVVIFILCALNFFFLLLVCLSVDVCVRYFTITSAFVFFLNNILHSVWLSFIYVWVFFSLLFNACAFTYFLLFLANTLFMST